MHLNVVFFMWKAVIKLREQNQYFLELRKHSCSKGNISFWFSVNDRLKMHIQMSGQEGGVGRHWGYVPQGHTKIATV